LYFTFEFDYVLLGIGRPIMCHRVPTCQ